MKVTDEMVSVACDAYYDCSYDVAFREKMRRALEAALAAPTLEEVSSPAWVDKLAGEWERYATECEFEGRYGGQGIYAEVQNDRATAFKQVAADLRERAQGGEP
jgi:hypothetical protein